MTRVASDGCVFGGSPLGTGREVRNMPAHTLYAQKIVLEDVEEGVRVTGTFTPIRVSADRAETAQDTVLIPDATLAKEGPLSLQKRHDARCSEPVDIDISITDSGVETVVTYTFSREKTVESSFSFTNLNVRSQTQTV